MKIFKHLLVSVLVLAFVGSPVTVFAQQQSEDEQKMMKLWMEYATPGENHKYLEYFVGKWEASAKMWQKPGDEPMVSKNVGKTEMILGGRYLKSYYKGEMMGKPTEGIGLTGYDNFKKKFISIWIDDMGTGIYMTSGTLDETGKVRTETGIWDDVMTGGKSKVKLVSKIIDKNKYSFDMYYTQPDGKEFKTMEMIFTRKQEK